MQSNHKYSMQSNHKSRAQAGLLLRVLRLKAGLGQAALAERTGVSQSTVSRWEQGLARPERGQAEAWCIACGAEADARRALLGYFAASPAEEQTRSAEVQRVLLNLVRTAAPPDEAQVPYFADVAAGLGEAQEQRTAPRQLVGVPRAVFERDPGAYALRVVGDSMAPRITDGDIVIVSPAAPLFDGCIVAAFVEPDGDVVKLYHELPGDAVLLQPLNPAYESVLIQEDTPREVRIWGRVVFQQREL